MLHFRVIGLEDNEIEKTKLDMELQAALDRNLKEISDAEKEIQSGAGEQEELQREIKQHHIDHARKIENKNRHLTKIKTDLEESDAKVKQLEEEVKGIPEKLTGNGCYLGVVIG